METKLHHRRKDGGGDTALETWHMQLDRWPAILRLQPAACVSSSELFLYHDVSGGDFGAQLDAGVHALALGWTKSTEDGIA